MSFLVEWMTRTWTVVLEAAPWLLGGFLMAGIIYVLLPTRKVVSHLGHPGLAGVLKASLVGIPLPLCSCSVIPVASSIRKQGASRGATASFLISTPETGVDSIAISYALLGPFLAAARPLAAFVTAIVAGCLINPLEKRHSAYSNADGLGAAEKCRDACSCKASNSQPVTLTRRIVTAARYGFVDLFADLSHWLVLGFLLSGLVFALVPARFLEETVGSGLGAMLLMVAAGLPLYVCATSSTPVAAALIAKGLSPGAALVFLLVGPATNIATMAVVGRDLGGRSLAVYVLSIVVVAVLCGLGTDAMLQSSTWSGLALERGCHSELGLGSWACALGLALLMLNGLKVRIGRLKSPTSRHKQT